MSAGLLEAVPLLEKSSAGGGSIFPERLCKFEAIWGTLLLTNQVNKKKKKNSGMKTAICRNENVFILLICKVIQPGRIISL